MQEEFKLETSEEALAIIAVLIQQGASREAVMVVYPPLCLIKNSSWPISAEQWNKCRVTRQNVSGQNSWNLSYYEATRQPISKNLKRKPGKKFLYRRKSLAFRFPIGQWKLPIRTENTYIGNFSKARGEIEK